MSKPIIVVYDLRTVTKMFSINHNQLLEILIKQGSDFWYDYVYELTVDDNQNSVATHSPVIADTGVQILAKSIGVDISLQQIQLCRR